MEGQAWWLRLAILALWRLSQEDCCDLKAILGNFKPVLTRDGDPVAKNETKQKQKAEKAMYADANKRPLGLETSSEPCTQKSPLSQIH